MRLGAAEAELLEDCQDDWQGLWEINSGDADIAGEKRAAFVSSLVKRGLISVLRINDWPEAKDAPSLPQADAIAVVSAPSSYAVPEDGSPGPFHVLAITPAGEAAVREAREG